MRKCVNELESFSQIRNTENALLNQTKSVRAQHPVSDSE